MGTIKKIGHRGAKGLLAENTLESIDLALHHGVDAIEIDVHRCRSGELVVIHDFTLERTTDGTGEIAQKSLEDLRSLRVEQRYTIPLLTEVLDLVRNKCTVNIELKGEDTAGETCRIIREYIKNFGWGYKDFIVSSFRESLLLEVKRLDKNIPLAILTEESLDQALVIGRYLKAKAIHPSAEIISGMRVKQLQEAGFQVNVWTVNTPEDIAQMKDFGVNGIITDYPDRF